jgi:hypothetical protein
VLKVLEGADDDLRAAARTYRVLADEIAQCDAVAAAARARIARAHRRLSTADRHEVGLIDRAAQRARDLLLSGARRRVVNGAIVAVSAAVIGVIGVSIVGVVSGLTATPVVGILKAFIPPNLVELWVSQWPNC